MDPVIARKLARTANPYPSVVFLAPEAAAAYAAAGLRPGRTGYFAGRAAPMGAVTAEVVIATFYSFQPDLIRSCIPAAWSAASPEVILGHRLLSVDAALRRILGDEVVSGPAIKEAARLARVAAEACMPEGRALFAGTRRCPGPASPPGPVALADAAARAPLAPLEALGEEGCLRLRELIRPMSAAIASQLLPR
jgi:hypothetical protein